MESGQHVPEAAAAERGPACRQAGALARVISPPLLHDVHCGDRRAQSVREQHSNICSGRPRLPPSAQPAPAQPWCPSLPQRSLWVAHTCWRQSGAWGSTRRRGGPKLPSGRDFITAAAPCKDLLPPPPLQHPSDGKGPQGKHFFPQPGPGCWDCATLRSRRKQLVQASQDQASVMSCTVTEKGNRTQPGRHLLRVNCPPASTGA